MALSWSCCCNGRQKECQKWAGSVSGFSKGVERKGMRGRQKAGRHEEEGYQVITAPARNISN